MDWEPEHSADGNFDAEAFLLARLQRELEGSRNRLLEIEQFHPLDRRGSADAAIDIVLITLAVYFRNNPQTVPHSKLLEEIGRLFVKYA